MKQVIKSNRSHVWILLAGMACFACSEFHGKPAERHVPLVASEWVLLPLHPVKPEGGLVKGPSYTLEFLDDSTFLFHLDAALAYGRYAYNLERKSIRFRNLAWVKNGCCASTYSLALLKALEDVSAGFLEKKHLRLCGKEIDMRFKPKYL